MSAVAGGEHDSSTRGRKLTVIACNQCHEQEKDVLAGRQCRMCPLLLLQEFVLMCSTCAAGRKVLKNISCR